MSLLTELISGSIDSNDVKQIAQKLGASEEQTQNAIGMALPTLLGALAKKSDDDASCQELHQQLQHVQGSSATNQLQGLLGGGAGSILEAFGGNAGSLLGSLLGGRQQKVEQGLGQASGLNSSQIGSLLAMLAPMILGAIGQQSKSNNLDIGGLKDMLQSEKQSMQKSAAGGLLSGLLDQDGDGDFDSQDLLSFGMKMLSGKK